MASGLPIPDTPADAGGLIVMVRPDPAEAARVIAADLRADLAIGGAQTERALARLATPELEHRDLDALATAMRRAEAVRDETRAAAARRLSASLNTTVAIHPDTLRRAAAELQAADEALAAATEGDARAERRGRRRRRSTGALLVAGGAGAAVLVAPPVGVAIVATGLAGSSWSARRARHRPLTHHDSLRSHRDAARVRWERVAGIGADPDQVESTIRRYDPQDDVVTRLIGQSPAVRAAERLAVQRRMAWVAAWREELGDDAPVAGPAVGDLLSRDATELWLTGTDGLADEPHTLVVASPYADLPEERARQLHRQLLGLPRGQRVIVILAPDPDMAFS